ncbi:uncharacterized protein LOC113341352 [Papaver somniferum]|uniref:uncharacterized protein LOC113341352 n=1 Tax=Papaver somniferum TaxID=3469 RepID=UPI000E6F71CF|nr:uncharacterized protein LOC113341352 [Papaver somniferum]
MQQPPGFVDPNFPDHVCHLKKSLYGLKQAPRQWFAKFSIFRCLLVFVKSVNDHSMFFLHSASDILVLLLYVDDINLPGNPKCLMGKLIASLKTEFAMKYLRNLNFFLGIEPVRHSDSLVLKQKKYTLELLERDKMLECKPCDTPVAKTHRASIHDDTLLEDPIEFRTIIGGLQYLTHNRPDICFGVNYVSQFMHAPTDCQLLLVKRILRYLKGSIGQGLTIHPGDVTSLKGYIDPDWAGCADTRRSISGYGVFLGSSLISWSSKKHHTVSKSSVEAEYKDLSVATAELKWISYVQNDLHVPLQLPVQLHCVNTSAIALSANPVFHARIKHIEIKYHTVRELIESVFLVVSHVLSEEQIADIFTKGLCFPSHSILLHLLLDVPVT